MKRTIITVAGLLLLILLFTATYNCAPDKADLHKVITISEDEYDPEIWGQNYPLHYESWQKTEDPKNGTSKYRKGWDKDKIIYDRLSEYPFAALLYHGWGFGIEYNEPRGHYYSIIDQVEIDPARTGPGGVCLACKTPYHKSYTEKYGMKYLTAKFHDALKMLPEKTRELGPACIDCHKASTMELTTNKLHLENGLKAINKTRFSIQEKRILTCAQCHITYFVPRTGRGKVAADVRLPWSGSSWGNISIENIIKDLLADYQREEWTQKTTGFRMPFIRHPEFEMFTKSSVHYNSGATCIDCHMPYTRSGSVKISDHDITSPLKKDMHACKQCHTENADWLKDQVITIQDRTTSLLLRAGYATATCAKLFEFLHNKQEKGIVFEKKLYNMAKLFYKKAFLRLNFVSAENSSGFHNPSEAGRILGDSISYAGKSEALLRQMLAFKKISVPGKIDLELNKYINNRGKKKLMFKKEQLVEDPYNIQKEFTDLP